MVSAYIFVQVAAGTDARKVHDALHAVAGVKTVHNVAGPVDAIVFVDAASVAALMETIGKMRATPGVAGTDTRIVLG